MVQREGSRQSGRRAPTFSHSSQTPCLQSQREAGPDVSRGGPATVVMVSSKWDCGVRWVLAETKLYAGVSEHCCGRYRISVKAWVEERSGKRLILAMDRIFVFSQSRYVEVLIPRVMAFRGVAFGGGGPRSWGWGPHDGVRALVRRAVREDLSTVCGHSEPDRGFSSEPNHACSLILDFQPPELWETNVRC